MTVIRFSLCLVAALACVPAWANQSVKPTPSTQARQSTRSVVAHNERCRYYRHEEEKTRRVYYTRQCGEGSVSDDIGKVLDDITPSADSVLNQRVLQQQLVSHFKYAISFYEPTYMLPGYYSTRVSPFYANNPGNTPGDVDIDHTEFSGQMSFIFPLINRLFTMPVSFNASYTQLIFWQLYSKSPYFRETNYEPRLFFGYHFHHNWLFNLGIDHQSNGRGGEGPSGMERSWNRVFVDVEFSGQQWLVVLEPWVPIMKKWSSGYHNPDIAHYLGYGRMVVAYQFEDGQELSLMSRNNFASGFSRGALELNYVFPIHQRVRGMLHLFSGYGQSLIEYNHYTNAIGLGIALSDWI